MANSKRKLKEAEEKLEQIRENRYKNRGGRATQVHRDPAAYSRKEKHKKGWE